MWGWTDFVFVLVVGIDLVFVSGHRNRLTVVLRGVLRISIATEPKILGTFCVCTHISDNGCIAIKTNPTSLSHEVCKSTLNPRQKPSKSRSKS